MLAHTAMSKCVIVKVIFGTLKRHSSGQHVKVRNSKVC